MEGLHSKQFERPCRNWLLAYGFKEVEVTRFSRHPFLRSTNEGGASVRQRTQTRTGCGRNGHHRRFSNAMTIASFEPG
jgi:hypothetical protein